MTTEYKQVGWYCDHADEIGWVNNTHVRRMWKRGKWVDQGATRGSYTHNSITNASERPICPRTQPVYIAVTA